MAYDCIDRSINSLGVSMSDTKPGREGISTHVLQFRVYSAGQAP